MTVHEISREIIRKVTAEIFYAALRRLTLHCGTESYERHPVSLSKRKLPKTCVAGFGKAACEMARALESAFADEVMEGLVITKYGHQTMQSRSPAHQERLRTVDAGIRSPMRTV